MKYLENNRMINSVIHLKYLKACWGGGFTDELTTIPEIFKGA